LTVGRRAGARKKVVALGVTGILLCSCAVSVTFASDDEKPEVEAEVPIPVPPKANNLVEFYVSTVATNRFYVDSASLSVSADGEIRYTVVITSAAGARNVSFEGIRCTSGERRLYAFGRPDNSWSKARNSVWVPINPVGSSRYQYVLMRDYFCPDGIVTRETSRIIEALKGGKPLSGSLYGS